MDERLLSHAHSMQGSKLKVYLMGWLENPTVTQSDPGHTGRLPAVVAVSRWVHWIAAQSDVRRPVILSRCPFPSIPENQTCVFPLGIFPCVKELSVSPDSAFMTLAYTHSPTH